MPNSGFSKYGNAISSTKAGITQYNAGRKSAKAREKKLHKRWIIEPLPIISSVYRMRVRLRFYDRLRRHKYKAKLMGNSGEPKISLRYRKQASIVL